MSPQISCSIQRCPVGRGKDERELSRFDISRWLPTDVESDLTGVADFDLLLGLGRHFPRGRFTFTGPHVCMRDTRRATSATTGTLIVDRVLVDNANGIA